MDDINKEISKLKKINGFNIVYVEDFSQKLASMFEYYDKNIKQNFYSGDKDIYGRSHNLDISLDILKKILMNKADLLKSIEK